ncbi:MAG: hypothetical protein LH632_15075 [Rhodoferax sp.]|nr:hypothetical protein [Rhodoferax sp.]
MAESEFDFTSESVPDTYDRMPGWGTSVQKFLVDTHYSRTFTSPKARGG